MQALPTLRLIFRYQQVSRGKRRLLTELGQQIRSLNGYSKQEGENRSDNSDFDESEWAVKLKSFCCPSKQAVHSSQFRTQRHFLFNLLPVSRLGHACDSTAVNRKVSPFSNLDDYHRADSNSLLKFVFFCASTNALNLDSKQNGCLPHTADARICSRNLAADH